MTAKRKVKADDKKPLDEPKLEDEKIEDEKVEENVTDEPKRDDISEEPKVEEKKEKGFVASQGRLRRLFLKSGLTGRISKEVFDILDKKIKSLVDQHIKSLVVKDKRIVYEVVEEREKICELPITPFRDYIKSIVKREHDISRVSPDIIESLHFQIEKDIIKLCQYAQDIMKNSTRKTLFANDIDVASKAVLRADS
jgi:hypothetical protein